MITQREKNAVALCRKVWENYNADSLALAKEILSMEQAISDDEVAEKAKAKAEPLSKPALTFSAPKEILSTANPTMTTEPPVMNEDTVATEEPMVYNPEDDLPFILTIPILPLIGLMTTALTVLCI
jgi:acetylglutamate synthase